MSNSADRVEVFSGVQRRRRYSLQQKLAAVAEASQPGMLISFVARRHGISPSLLFGWTSRMTAGGKGGRALGRDGRAPRRGSDIREADPRTRARAREKDPGERDPAARGEGSA